KSRFSSLLLIAVAGLSVAAPALAQTQTITNTPPPMPANLQDGLSYVFGLHKAGLELFTNSWEFEFSAGASVPTSGSVQQENQFALWKRVDSFTEMGGDFEVLSLGMAGQEVQQLGGHADLRVDWDNLAGVVGVGPFRNMVDDRWGGELELAAEYRLTQGVGGKIAYYPGYEGGKGFVSRIFAGITIAIGK
ncbi:MAG TPA: hypothetical protein VN829_10775, partial [Dongiaceae bacterium]|nr:hypothetical protein [Dongiaceae bacterium]